MSDWSCLGTSCADSNPESCCYEFVSIFSIKCTFLCKDSPSHSLWMGMSDEPLHACGEVEMDFTGDDSCSIISRWIDSMFSTVSKPAANFLKLEALGCISPKGFWWKSMWEKYQNLNNMENQYYFSWKLLNIFILLLSLMARTLLCSRAQNSVAG